jgi:hypothetical protein
MAFLRGTSSLEASLGSAANTHVALQNDASLSFRPHLGLEL